MDSTLGVIVVLAVVAVLGYLMVMRVFVKESKALDRNIDIGKMKKWKDED